MTDMHDTWAWLEHLTPQDQTLLARSAPDAGVDPDQVVHDRTALASVLSHPATWRAVWDRTAGEPLLAASPFLVFATAVHRGWTDLQGAHHVNEWVGARRRVPVLGATDLKDFLAAEPRRLFLIELLASYTHVASGSTWERTARGWRRRRFSELDPVRFASLLEQVPDEQRPGVYRRLGDLALFLTGVFPDHTALQGIGPVAEGRLLRAGGLPADTVDRPGYEQIASPVGLLEHLGQRWYRLACRTAGRPLTGTMPVVADVAERFADARRVLNFITDRYLFPVRNHWFGEPAA